MTYDQWKCSDPNESQYDYYDEDRECDHDEYSIDIVTGEWSCDYCNYRRAATDEDIEMECRRQQEYSEMMEREERRQWWSDRTYPLRMFIHRILARIWPRKSLSVLHDDEIPF